MASIFSDIAPIKCPCCGDHIWLDELDAMDLVVTGKKASATLTMEIGCESCRKNLRLGITICTGVACCWIKEFTVAPVETPADKKYRETHP